MPYKPKPSRSPVLVNKLLGSTYLKLRLSKNISQQYVESCAKVTKGTLSKFELGLVNVSAQSLMHYLGALEVDNAAFWKIIDDMPPHPARK